MLVCIVIYTRIGDILPFVKLTKMSVLSRYKTECVHHLESNCEQRETEIRLFIRRQ